MYRNKSLQNTGKGIEDHAAFTSDKKNDFSVPKATPPHEFLPTEDINQCMSLICH